MCRQDSWVVVPLYSIHKHQQKEAAAANGTSTSSTVNDTAKGSNSSSGGSKGSSAKGSGRGGKGPGVQPVVVPDGCVEGTRLTLVNVPNQPDAVEFSIR
jgi:hypothetical protein